MATFAEKMPEIDALIFGVLGDRMIIGSTEVKGIFYKRYREVVLPDGSIAALELSFDCQVTQEILALAPGAVVSQGSTNYAFRQRMPEGGDESGKVTLVLERAP